MHINIFSRIKLEWRRINKKAVKIGAVVTLLCGILSSVFTYLIGGRSRIYYFLNLPLWAPPRFIFPIIWTVLYILIGGVTGAIFCGRDGFREADKYKGLLLFVIMMIFNVIWSPLFFGAYAFFLAFLDILIMIILTFFIIKLYCRIYYVSAAVMTVYIIWLVYSLILNFSIVLAN